MFTNYDKFAETVGLITDLAELESINAPKPSHENGLYETTSDQTDALMNFLEANPEYHLATFVDDDDCSESDEQEKIWFEQNPTKNKEDFETFSENEVLWEAFREENQVYVFCIDNSVRFVNRMGYYLANGDTNPQHYLTEIERGDN